jgi:arylsulfatase A-like enzyme
MPFNTLLPRVDSTRRDFLSLLGASAFAAAAPAAKPNVVVILADDLGYGDLSCYGATKISTPNCDRLAREGVRFTNAYTPSSVCSPTRYGLLTGRYCWRTSLQRQVLNVQAPLHIEPSRLTLPSLFKKHGYTSAAIGKWHLGYGNDPVVNWNKPLRPGPLELGFDYHFGVPSNHGDATRAYVRNDTVLGLTPGVPFKPGAREKPPEGLSQRRVDDRVNVTLAGEAVQFLERSAKQPFFLYFTPVAVHNPVTPNKQFRGRSAAGLYGDYVLELDWAVGQVLSTLDRLKLADNTLVLFSSDNGGVVMSYNRAQGQQQAAGFDLNLEDDSDGKVTQHYRLAQLEAEEAGHKIAGDLRGRKHSIYEGGFRVPYMVRWPGKTRAASTSAEVVSLVDTLATCAGILGEPLPRNAAEDSYDVLPAILGRKLSKSIREATVVHNAEGVFAIRQGPWKLIEERTWDDKLNSPWRREAVNQLYNLDSDPAEKNNVWEQNPEVVARMRALLKKYREQGFSRPMA